MRGLRYVEPVEKTHTGYQKDTPKKTLPKRSNPSSDGEFKLILEEELRHAKAKF